MRRYEWKNTLDIYSYVSKNIIDLDQLEDIFHKGINDTKYVVNGYHVERYEQGCELKEKEKVVSNLENKGRSVAFIKECEKVIAVVGYKER